MSFQVSNCGKDLTLFKANNQTEINNQSVNALDSFENRISAIENFADKNDSYLESLPPLEFEYRYMPNIVNGNLNKKALMEAAYQELGGVEELSVQEFEDRYLLTDELTAKPLDINNDGKINVAEYAANMLATDVLSKGSTNLSKADGTVNARGMDAVLEYAKKSNAVAAAKLYASIYNQANLGSEINKM